LLTAFSFSYRYDLKQMLMKSEISRVPEELRKHEAAQQKPTKGGQAQKRDENAVLGGKGGW
jgi:ATP-dependent RNA helicase DDX23/PRP28